MLNKETNILNLPNRKVCQFINFRFISHYNHSVINSSVLYNHYFISNVLFTLLLVPCVYELFIVEAERGAERMRKNI